MSSTRTQLPRSAASEPVDIGFAEGAVEAAGAVGVGSGAWLAVGLGQSATLAAVGTDDEGVANGEMAGEPQPAISTAIIGRTMTGG
jgi:hypothetical protein